MFSVAFGELSSAPVEVHGKCSNDLVGLGSRREDCSGIAMETSSARNENQKSEKLKGNAGRGSILL